jgi:LuxR family maltose regulon positive regulatory protein
VAPESCSSLAGRDEWQQVLRLLATEPSTQEIAKELVVSIATLRTHIKRIYSKLDAHNRTEALQRAHELGLI